MSHHPLILGGAKKFGYQDEICRQLCVPWFRSHIPDLITSPPVSGLYHNWPMGFPVTEVYEGSSPFSPASLRSLTPPGRELAGKLGKHLPLFVGQAKVAGWSPKPMTTGFNSLGLRQFFSVRMDDVIVAIRVAGSNPALGWDLPSRRQYITEKYFWAIETSAALPVPCPKRGMSCRVRFSRIIIIEGNWCHRTLKSGTGGSSPSVDSALLRECNITRLMGSSSTGGAADSDSEGCGFEAYLPSQVSRWLMFFAA